MASVFGVSNAAIVSTTLLLVVLLVAAASSLAAAVTTSLAAMLSLNFFFLPPVGTFTIADPQNWVALFGFLVVSLVASHLSNEARTRTAEAMTRRDELARLFDFSRDVLLISDGREALDVLARAVARRLDLEFAAIAVHSDGEWDIHAAGPRRLPVDERQLNDVFSTVGRTLEFDARARTYAGHRSIVVDGEAVRMLPLRIGARPVGLFAAAGRSVEAGTLDTLAGILAIAIERAHFLDERRAAALTRQSEQLKTTLLASLGHDLRTPLTAIRVAAANLGEARLADGERRDQADLILAEVERLTRLFENVLEMARIDAGAVAAEPRRTHPSEIIAAARDQVERTLAAHPVDVVIGNDEPVPVDPRLTAAALAHLLENAAHYSPAGSPILISADVGSSGLTLKIRDRGPGIHGADMPRLFDRFFRGSAGDKRRSGSGMGLWIARSLLSVEGGRIWAENLSSGGTEFTIAVPIATVPLPAR